tara:strand:+ start:2110 stop:2985 length:876 start_codon:yes stop_codon:yes gene_type:complete
MKIIFVIPVYNDEASLKKLINNIKIELEKFTLHFVVVDDCSKDDFKSLTDLSEIDLISLKHNHGSQKAISIGLNYILNKKTQFDHIIIMDSDGEDKPEDLRSLIKNSVNDKNHVIFASRKKRLETTLFKFFYFLYRCVFKLLTGNKINFGNFSCISKELLNSIVTIPYVDYHYSAAIINSKQDYKSIPCDKGNRYMGQSKMSFFNLVFHAFKSLSIFSKKIFIRFLIMFFITNFIFIYSKIDSIIILNSLIIFFASPFFIYLFWLRNKIFKKENLMNNSNYRSFIRDIKSL